jgi:hypothetical protein
MVDYTNTIIYKIYCKNENITDLYVGHTTNFLERKYAHKLACNNLKNTQKIYSFIRNNGGWENWDIIEIAKYNCKDVYEARKREQEHFEKLNATLNTTQPYFDKNNFFCLPCNSKWRSKNSFQNHIITNKHKENTSNKIKNKENSKFNCEPCNFFCNKKYSWERHQMTFKHKKKILEKVIETNKEVSKSETIKYTCVKCQKNYKYRQGLWKHKKICKKQNEITEKNEPLEITEKKELDKTHNINVNILEDLLKENTKIIKKIARLLE